MQREDECDDLHNFHHTIALSVGCTFLRADGFMPRHCTFNYNKKTHSIKEFTPAGLVFKAIVIEMVLHLAVGRLCMEGKTLCAKVG